MEDVLPKEMEGTVVVEVTIILTAKMINNTNTTAQIETIMEAATEETLDFFNIIAEKVATNVDLLASSYLILLC